MTRIMLHIRQWALAHKRICVGVMLTLLVLFPFTVRTGMPVRVVSTIMIYCLLTMGNMLISGHTGMLNMGHAAFYGVGAYTSALLSVNLGAPFAVCFLAAGITTGLCGFLIAFPCLRVQTDFLSLITIAFANVFVAILNNWVSVTRGPMGVPGVPTAQLLGYKFDTPLRYYFLLLTVVTIVYVLLRNLVKSKVGRAMQATRDDEIGARAAGINVKRQKVLAFTVGTFVAGLAGSLMAHYIGFVGPGNFTFDESLLVMQMCILGGLGSLPGAIVGASFMTVMPEFIRPLAQYRLGVGGLIMILCMLFRPQGILGSRAFAGDSGLQDKIKQKLLILRMSNREKEDQKWGAC